MFTKQSSQSSCRLFFVVSLPQGDGWSLASSLFSAFTDHHIKSVNCLMLLTGLCLTISGGKLAVAQAEFTDPLWRQVRSTPEDSPESSVNQVAPERVTQPTSPSPIVTRQTAFGVPFSVSTDSGPIREVQLHISQDKGVSWSLYSRQLPTAKEFPFRASRDGEYWFAVKTLGSTIPEKNLKPELVIAIDSGKPQLNVSLKTDSVGRVVVALRGGDPNLDVDSLKIQYQSTSSWGQPAVAWRSVQLPKFIDGSGTMIDEEIAFHAQTSNVAINIRFSIADKAGNVTILTRRINLPRTALRRQDSRITFDKAESVTGRSDRRQEMTSSEVAIGVRPPGVDPYSKVLQQDKEDGAESVGLNAFDRRPELASSEVRQGWHVLGQSGFTQDFNSNTPSEADYRKPEKSQADVSSQSGPVSIPSRVNDPNFRSPKKNSSSMFASTQQSINQTRQDFNQGANLNRIPDGEYAKLSNSRKFELDYQVDHIRADDIAKLEIWVTENGGGSWQMQSIDQDRQSPVLIDVDDDGVYGFRLRIQTNDGLESLQPTKGDSADVWVEVDTTKPSVELASLPFGRKKDAGKLIVNWRAVDKRFAAKPITLFYSVNLDGPWQVIVEKLPNSSQFKWPVTDRIPRRVFLRIEAVDAAGNRNVHQTSQSIDLSGLNPRGMIRSVRPIQ